MISNVPGPQVEVRMCGARVTNMSFYLFSLLGTYAGVLSYAGKVTASMNMDASIGVDPADVLKYWGPSFDSIFEEMVGSKAAAPAATDEQAAV